MEKIKIILASSSPRRQELLKKIGLSFTVKKSSVNEHFNLKLKPHLFAEHWAEKKAKNVSKKSKNSIIISADTIVTLDGMILGKPTDKKDNIRMLKKLSGRMHEVITGVTIYYEKLNIISTFNSKTKIFFYKINDNEIVRYIENEKPSDKSGGYGIQDSIAKYIKKIDGCYYNVVGFPLSKFHKHFLLTLKIIENEKSSF